MNLETSAIVLTPEGETAPFPINTGVLQSDPLAPFLFIVVLAYALRQSISPFDGILPKRHRSARHLAKHIADLDYLTETKVRIFKQSVETFLLYSAE